MWGAAGGQHPVQEQKFVAPGRYESIRPICEFVAQAARSAGLSADAAFHVELAVDEACTNIVEHAYLGGSDDEIIVICGTGLLLKDRVFVVRLQDRGKPFNPSQVPAPDVTLDLEQLRVGGLGIHFMRKTMDQVEYRFTPGRNELTMYKKIEWEMAGNGSAAAPSAVWGQQHESGVWLVGVRGRLDHTSVPELEGVLDQLHAAGSHRLVVDLHETTYINSGGLRVLVTAWRRARSQSGDVHLCCLTDRLTEIFEMAGFERIFVIHPSSADAIRALVQ